jgi:ribonuclease HIII
MDPSCRALAERVKSYWLAGGEDRGTAGEIITAALEAFPPHGLLAARCLVVMEQRKTEISQGIRLRIEAFRDELRRLLVREAQLDALGDLDTPPEAIFEVLGEASTDLAPEAFDVEALHKARLGLQSRIHSAWAMLEALGPEQFPPELADELRAAANDLKERAERFPALGLFVDGKGRGFVLGLNVQPEVSGEIRHYAEAGKEMAHQARIALDEVFHGAGARWDIEWPLQYEGSSVGLGLYIGGLIVRRGLALDPLLAATGALEVGGAVRGVDRISEKLEAAAAAGIRRVLLSEENRPEAEASPASSALELLFVSHVREVESRLAGVTAHAELTFEGRVRMARNLFSLFGLALVTERKLQNAHRFEVADAQGKVAIDLYTGPAGTVRVNGPEGSAKRAAQILIREHVDRVKSRPRPPFTFMVPTDLWQRRLLETFLGAGATETDRAPHVQTRLQVTRGTSVAVVTVFSTHKAVLSGAAPAYDQARQLIAQALEGLAGVEEVLEATFEDDVPSDAPHIGTDEAGKGDYFGPLVSAAVFADEDIARRLQDAGVRDSKKLADATVRKLATQISELARGKVAVTPVNPRRFNGLYQQMRAEGKNLNTLLAWGHARSIEDLLGKRIDPDFAIIDQFADARYIEEKILADTRQRKLRLIQRPKAESDVAVAAASILARAAFLEWMEKTSQELGMALPKGASERVVEAARELVRRFGAAKLGDVAKLSFKTTKRVFEE